MKLARFMLRLFGFIQWFAAVVIAAFCVWIHVDTIEQVGDLDEAGVAMDVDALAVALSPIVATLTVSIPGLLLSILLMLSARYWDQAVRPRPSRTGDHRSEPWTSSDARLPFDDADASGGDRSA